MSRHRFLLKEYLDKKSTYGLNKDELDLNYQVQKGVDTSTYCIAVKCTYSSALTFDELC